MKDMRRTKQLKFLSTELCTPQVLDDIRAANVLNRPS